MKTQEKVRLAKQMRDQGYSWDQVGKELGIQPATINAAVLKSPGGGAYRSYKKKRPHKMKQKPKQSFEMQILQNPDLTNDQKLQMISILLEG